MASCSCWFASAAFRHAEAFADVCGCLAGGPAQRHLLEEQREDERDDRHRAPRPGRRRGSRARTRRRSARSVRPGRRAAPAGVVDRGGVDPGRRGDRAAGSSVAEHVGVDRAEHRRAERAAQGAEEGDAGGARRRGPRSGPCSAPRSSGSACDEPIPMPRTSMATAICQYGVSTPSRDSRYRPTAITADADHREDLVPPGPADHRARDHRHHQQAGDHRQGLQARLGRRRRPSTYCR